VGKIIKNIGRGMLRSLGFLFEFILVLLIVLVFVIRTAWFQTYVAEIVADYFSEEFGTEVTVERVNIRGFNYSEIIGLHIRDQRGDTLIYSPSFSGSIGMLNMKGELAIISAVNSKNTRFKLQKYEGEEKTNIQFLLDYFSSDDTTESNFKIEIDELNLHNIHFSYDNWNKPPVKYGMDYDHLDIKRLYGSINDIRNGAGETSLTLSEITLSESCGLFVENLTSNFVINKKVMSFGDLYLKTDRTSLNCRELSFSYRDFGDLSDFANAVNMAADVAPSGIHLRDISYFVPNLREIDKRVKLEGKLLGRVNNFQLDSLYIGLNAGTFFKGSADVKGLPDVEGMVFTVLVEKLQTNAKELNTLDFTAFGMTEDLEIPTEIERLGVVKLSGDITGDLSWIATNLVLETDEGEAEIKLDLKELNNEYNYLAEIKTTHIHLGDILDNKDLGDFTSKMKIDGKGFTIEDLDTEFEGHFEGLDLLGYHYDKIDVAGHFLRKDFKGKFSIKDDNLISTFTGELDLNKRKPAFDFLLDIEHAHLANLNLVERETAAIRGKVRVKGKGVTPDDFNGVISVNNLAYYQEGNEYEFDSVRVESKKDIGYHDIKIFSEFANVSMTGDYKIAELDESLYNLGSRVFPSLFPIEDLKEVADETFDLYITIKDLSMITSLFMPELKVAPYTNIGINYVSEFELMELSAQSDWIEYGAIRLAGLRIDTTQKFALYDPFYTLDIYTDTTYVSETLYFENLAYKTDLYNDNVHTTLTWYRADSANYGYIETDIDIASPSNMIFDLHPSTVYTDKIGNWHLDQDAIIIMDSTSFKLDNMLIQNKYQSISMKGKISEDPNEYLKLDIANFDLNNLDPFMIDTSLYFKGRLLVTGNVSNVYDVPYFDAYSWAEGVKINKYKLGNLETVASWNPLDNRIEIESNLFKTDLDTIISIHNGYYYIDSAENLDFNVHINKLNLEFANLFMPDGFSKLKGEVAGDIALSNNFQEPHLEGSLDIFDAGLNIDMLNTAYYASGNISIVNDFISFNSMPIKDKLGAKGYLSGGFYHQNFEKYSYDFFAGFDEPFQVMNTTYKMNPLYYGNAYVTGDISIAYDDYNLLEINVNATSEKGTDITLPLYGAKEVVLQDFISFVNHDSSAIDNDHKIDLEGINLNLSMDITEDAKIQLVFDDVVGDVMKGVGVGHIDMYIDQYYDFYMFGNYEIIQGSYLFTLKDLINKKFKVKKGGSIAWYGDPYDADIDITAVYNVKTSLYDIMPENQREAYRQKTEVECEMRLTDNLFDPNIHFDINLPRSDENAKSIVRSIVNNETEMNKQVFALLLLNKFLPSEYSSGGSSGGSVLGNTTSEMLSNQLSNMLTKFSDDFDIGFNYQPGDEISSQEMALALSTQLLDDRLTISTNVGVSHQNAGEKSNSLIGDVDVEYKLNDEGNVRVHGFNRSNEYDITQQESTYTQGVGVFYQESFSTFGELMCKFRNLFVRDEKECKYCNESYKEILDEDLKKKVKNTGETIEGCREAR
jgi:hypothetical protein